MMKCDFENFDEYGFRNLIIHMILAGDEKAQEILTNIDFLISRLKRLVDRDAVYGVSNDWNRMKAFIPLEGESRAWEEFWRTNEHLLLRGESKWPSYKIFVQLAWEYRGKSFVCS